MMRTSTLLRVVIAGAGLWMMIGGVGDDDLLQQAHADNPPCVASETEPCLQHTDQAATVPPPQRHRGLVCQPAGIFGSHCYRR